MVEDASIWRSDIKVNVEMMILMGQINEYVHHRELICTVQVAQLLSKYSSDRTTLIAESFRWNPLVEFSV